MNLDYYIYAVMFAFCLVRTGQLMFKKDWEKVSGFAVGTFLTFFALYISTFWSA